MASDILNFNGNIFANKFFKGIYGDFCPQELEKRFRILSDIHANLFEKKPDMWFSSPGRIEIVGNHTDHNNGEVLCASVSLDTLACVNKAEKTIILKSEGYPLITLDSEDISIHEEEKSTSAALIRGVCAYFVNNGFKVGGFSASCTSNVFKGAGISSSASFELLIAEILNVLYNDGKISDIDKAKAAHLAEYEYFGKPCGLLDQCAISFGGVCYIDFFDGEPHPIRLEKVPEMQIVLVNAGGDHSSLTPQYAAIREEMELVASQFDKKVLREVPEKDFLRAYPTLRRKLPGRALLRSLHYYSENKRVNLARKAIEDNDSELFFEQVNNSGISSMCILQNCFPEGDRNQYIPTAVEYLKSLQGVHAARVHGGGFAGTALAFADKNVDLVSALDIAFGRENYYLVSFRNIGAAQIPAYCFNKE